MVRKTRVKYPTHPVEHRVYECVLDASEPLAKKLFRTLDVTWALQERLRQQRADDRALGRAVRATGGEHKYLTKTDQYKAISALVASDPAFQGIHSQVLQDVADRVERGTQRWLKGKGGPLKPQARKRHRSFTFTQYGFAAKIVQGRLHLSRLGEARLIGLRKLPGRPKAVTVVWKSGRWFAQFLCEVQTQHSDKRSLQAVSHLPDTGLDTGLARVATLADGTVFTPAKPLKVALKRLRHAQRALSRKFETRKKSFKAYCTEFVQAGLFGPLPERDHRRYSGRLQRQVKAVARVHTKVANARRDQHRKTARRMEQNYRLVAVEEHSLAFMAQNKRTSRAVADVAPGMFKSILKNVLGESRYLGVPNRRPGIGGNSQTCLCGASVPKTLADRWHTCTECGLSADRDVVSANIAMDIALGYSVLGATQPPGPGQGCVKRGEDKRSRGQPWGTECRATGATESSVKRQSSGRQRLVRSTPGAQATGEVKNPQPLGRRLSPDLGC